LFFVSRVQEVGLSDSCYLFSVFQQAISSVSITSELSSQLSHFRLNADNGIDFRRRLLRAQYWVLRRVWFRVQTWICKRRRGAHLLPCLNASESLADDSLLLAQYITWVNNNKSAWTMNAGGTAADDKVNIGPRPVAQEPIVCPSSLASHYISL